jgi:phospholipid/cholesterol/gamma-HCH transport system substrate-binding protein
MKKYRYETVAGIFVLIGLVCVGYMAVKLGKVKLLDHDSYPLYARFSSVSGLRTGNPVEMLGIQIGEVVGFRLDQEKQVVMTEFKIREGIKVYEDAIASIKTSGLIGDRYVSLDAGGSGAILKPGGVITQTESPPDLSDLIGKYAFGEVGKEGGKEGKEKK